MRPSPIRSILVAVLAWTGTASASSVSVQAEIRVPAIQNLETTPGIIEIAPVTISDLERGLLEIPEPVTLAISSNAPWELFVKRVDPSGPAVLGSLDRGPFREIGRTWLSIATGTAGADDLIRRLQLRVAVSWTTAAPGDRGLRLAYRLAPRGH